MRMKQLRVLTKWINKNKAAAFQQWIVATEKLKTMQQVCLKVLMKLRHRCLHTSFDSWLHIAQREAHEQERLVLTEQYSKAFARKEGETHRLKQTVALQRARAVVSRMRKHVRASAFYSWSSWSTSEQRHRHIIKKIATRWYLIAVGKCLRRWQAAVARPNTVLMHRSRLEDALHRWLRWGVSDAFSTWRESADRNLSRSLFVHGMVQRVSQQQDETKEQHLKLLGERLLRKWFYRSLVRRPLPRALFVTADP